MSTPIEIAEAEVLPPTFGAIGAVQVTTTPVVVDLTTLPRSPAAPTPDEGQQNCIGKYVRVTAELGDIYFATGNNANALANINATAYSAVNATTHAITVNGNEGDYILQGSWKDVLAVPGSAPQAKQPPGGDSPSRYISFVTKTGTSVARFHQASP
jgi:hypothetical protein